MCDNVLQESFEELNCRKGALLFVGSFTCPSPKNLALTGWSCVEVAAQIGKYFFSSAFLLGFGCFWGNRLKNRPPIKSAESSAAGGSRYVCVCRGFLLALPLNTTEGQCVASPWFVRSTHGKGTHGYGSVGKGVLGRSERQVSHRKAQLGYFHPLNR